MASAVGDFFSTFNEFRRLVPLKFAKPPTDDEIGSIGGLLERNAVQFAEQEFISFEGKSLTWAAFNALTNQFANLLIAQGVKPGDTVSLLMENRIEQLAMLIAIQKTGAVAGLINTNLRGRPLIHCVTVTASRKCVVGEELVEAVAEVKDELPLSEGDYLFVADAGATRAPNWMLDASAQLPDQSSANPPTTVNVAAGDTAMYIFTSGTTGLPKAAKLSHRRYLMTASVFARAAIRLRPTDRIYLCLPLYHGTGLMCGVGTAMASGASIHVRRRFSASRFLSDVRELNTNCFVYIGELCRYLMHQPESPDDADNPIVKMVGNGLRPDIWKPFKARFGIDRVSEFYGASEGNAGFVNLLNKDETIGTTIYDVALIQYDVDADEIRRDASGLCLKTEEGEAGLLVARIDETQRFEGYTDPEATEKKIVHNVFEQGDAYFNSGDLIRQVDVGFSFGMPHFQFVDRIGDTFRWKSENVSTNEVGEIINTFDGIRLCNVYGVEVANADGRAGMASIALEEGVATLDLERFAAFVKQELPSYARPVFLRILQADAEVTGTFKLVKTKARDDAYHLDKVADPLFVMMPRTEVYVPLTDAIYQEIAAGRAGF